jgi:hypothetical protein
MGCRRFGGADILLFRKIVPKFRQMVAAIHNRNQTKVL